MEIKDFITKSIEQICFGVREARNSVAIETGNFAIAPAFFEGKAVDKEGTNIHFDIAVTLTDDEKLNAVGNVGIKIAGGSLEKQNSTKTENTHRISFSVPFYPQALNANNKK